MDQPARVADVRGGQNVHGNYNIQDNFNNYGPGGFIAKAEHVTVDNRASKEKDLFDACIAQLPLTNVEVDLNNPLNNRERRLKGSCRWILKRPEYTKWLENKSSPHLLLVGPPGIGKTMLSAFLVEELKTKLKEWDQTLVYFFCDNKNARRRTETAILRGILYQLRNQGLLKHIVEPYRRLSKSLFDRFDELSHIFSAVVDDTGPGPLYILIDGIDECETSSLLNIMRLFGNLMDRSANIKLLIASRPYPTVEDYFDKCLPIDSKQVPQLNVEINRYIDIKVGNLAKTKHYSEDLKGRVLTALHDKSDGTFLWASLILEQIADAGPEEIAILKNLEKLPRNLNDIYRRILAQVEWKSSKEAVFVFRLLAAARRPLHVNEVDLAYYLWSNTGIKSIEETRIRKEIYKCCGAMVYMDKTHQTVNFVHQSAKDYLLNSDDRFALSIFLPLLFTTVLWRVLTFKRLDGFVAFQTALLIAIVATYVWPTPVLAEAILDATDLDFTSCRFRVLVDESNFELFKLCWQYFCIRFKLKDAQSLDEADFRIALENDKQFPYAAEEWLEHGLASSPASASEVVWIRRDLVKMPFLRDKWFLASAQYDHGDVMLLLLKNGADILSKNDDGLMAIDMAAENKHWDIVQALLDKEPNLVPRRFQSTTERETEASNENWIDKYALAAEWYKNIDDFKETRTATGIMWGIRVTSLAYIWFMMLYPSTALLTMKGPGWRFIAWLSGSKLNECETLRWRDSILFQTVGFPLMLIPILLFSSSLKWWSQYFILKMRERIHGRGSLALAADILLGMWQFSTSMLLTLALSGNHTIVAKQLLWMNVKLDIRDQDGWPPLMYAVDNENYEMVKLLVDKGANPNFKQSDGKPPICLAAEKGNAKIINLLLATGKVGLNSKDFQRRTPLIWAATKGQISVIKVLLDLESIDVNATDLVGHTALCCAARSGSDEAVKLLLSNNKTKVNVTTKFMETPLTYALINKHESTARLLLETGQIDVSSRYGTDGRWTVLTCAACHGCENIVKLVLEHPEVDINESSGAPLDYTALLCAASKGYVGIVSLLLTSAGIDVHSKTNLGETAFTLAARGGHMAVVNRLVACPEMELDSRTRRGRTPLSYACERGHQHVVQYLIDSGKVEIDSMSDNNWTPLMYAARGGHEAVVELLIKCGKADVNCKSKSDRPAISYAADYGHEGVVKILLQTGKVDVNSKKKGRSPLFYAIRGKHTGVAEVLRTEGAVITVEEAKCAKDTEENLKEWSDRDQE